MTLISKTTAIASLVSCVRDIHNVGKIYSNNNRAKSSSDTFLSGVIASTKANNISLKDTERKNWFMMNNPFVSIAETIGSIAGYLKGIGIGALRYIPNIILAIPALLVKKHPKVANLAALGLGIVEAADFIRNTFGIGERSDYLK